LSPPIDFERATDGRFFDDFYKLRVCNGTMVQYRYESPCYRR